MQSGSRRGILSTVLLSVAFALSTPALYSQARGDMRPSEQVFKNIQSLKGVPAGEFMETMSFFSAAIGQSCNYCHIDEAGASWARYADDNEHKKTTRRMIAMVDTINKNFFHGRRMLTCYSCHRGTSPPETTPDLALENSTIRFREPDGLVKPFPNAPEVEQVLDKYLQAIGGAQKAAGLSSIAAKGTYRAYGIPTKYEFELYAKAPAQRTAIVHSLGGGDNVTTYDGREGWSIAPAIVKPMPLMELTTGELDGARLDAMISFPAQIKQMLHDWRVGPPATLEDRDVTLVQGTMDGRLPVNLYFDDESGLLVRSVRFADSLVGLAPTQVDYADYREVAGMKVPFKLTVTWLSGLSTIQLSEIQANVAIDASKFARPAR